MAVTAARTDLSARAQVRAWIAQQIAGQSEVKVPELRAQVVEHFKGNASVMERLLAETLSGMIYELARAEISATRGKANVIDHGDTVTTIDEVKGKAIKLRHKWDLFREYAGDRHVRLMDMTPADLQLAEQTRQARGDIEHEFAELWRRLRQPLEEGEAVGDRFTVEDIENIYQGIVAGKE
jgi:hypothetical protein